MDYVISVDQDLNGIRLRRIILFKTLSFESTNEHVEDGCCKEGLTENELMFIEECLDRVCNLTNVECVTVTYIAGYGTRKEFGKNCEPPNHEINPNFKRDCEFLNLA